MGGNERHRKAHEHRSKPAEQQGDLRSKSESVQTEVRVACPQKAVYWLQKRFAVELPAEFERELIRERVKAGMKNTKAKGARIGRPRANVDAVLITRLRESGASLRDIAAQLGVSVGTVATCSKRVSRTAAVVA